MSVTGWTPAGAAAPDYAAIYARHAPEIHDFLVRTVRDHAAAEDLTQTTFTRLLEKGDTVREAEKVRPWLFTVAHNLAVNHVTRRRPSDPIEAAFAIASGDKGPEEEALATAAAALVWDAARSLEPRQYAILDLSVRHGFAVGEIAEVLEISPGHAAVLVHRAREALAQAIRLLVVVRQRRHCARLAEIVPAGTDLLTPDLRASVDRHMRRCEVCRDVGARLTDPVELFGALPLLPLPIVLHTPIVLHQYGYGPHGVPQAPAAPAAPAPAPAHAPLNHAAQLLQHAVSNPAAIAVVAGVAALGLALGTILPRAGHHDSAPSPHGDSLAIRAPVTPPFAPLPQSLPPLTGGETLRSRSTVHDTGADIVIDSGGAVLLPAPSPTASPSPSPAPTPPPPQPQPTPLLDLLVTGAPLTPAGVHVVVGPVPPVPPSVSVTVIGPDGKPIRSF